MQVAGKLPPVSRTAWVLVFATLIAGIAFTVLSLQSPEKPAAAPQATPAPATPENELMARWAAAAMIVPAGSWTSIYSAEGAVLADSEVRASPDERPAGRFIMPLANWSAVTDRFGAPRGPGFVHGGIDLALEGLSRSPVYASCAGTVTTASLSSVYGYHVILDCGEGWGSLYGHLSEIRVREGQYLPQGAVLGLTGSTGFSTGEHLHFEIWYRGQRVNPEDYLDFKIPEGTPLSSGPLVFGPGSRPAGGNGAAATNTPGTTNTTTPEATATNVPPTATATATHTPTNTPTPTPTPTFTPTPTPVPPTPTRTPTPPPIIR